MSGIFNMLANLGNSAGAVNGTSILMQAIGAAMRGESAQSFMTRLANEHPQLKSVDMNDLTGSAEKLAKEKGVNLEQVKTQIDGAVNSAMNK